MEFVVRDVIEVFSDSSISILTKKENYYAMKMISDIDDVIIFPKDHFFLNSLSNNEKNKFSKLKFHRVIIPINGQIESYFNIKLLSKELFPKADIYYYLYPKNFIKEQKSFLKEIFYFRMFKTFVFVASLLLTMIITLYIFLFRIFNFFKDNFSKKHIKR